MSNPLVALDVTVIRRDLERHGMTQAELADMARLSTRGVEHILSVGACSFWSADRIAVALGRHPSEVVT